MQCPVSSTWIYEIALAPRFLNLSKVLKFIKNCFLPVVVHGLEQCYHGT